MKRLYQIVKLLLLGVIFNCQTLFAAEVEVDKNPFNYLKELKIAQEPELLKTAVSWNELVMAIGISGMFITIISIAVRLALSGSGPQIAEIKKNISTKTIIAICIFTFATILSLVFTIVKEMAL